ncbi:MAG: MaoC/PaaZ C-terminal domain-containing protein [Actinomycetota bacterium]
MGLNAALAGKVYPTRTFAVTADGIRKYAEATNEDNPRFVSDDPVAPPAFPFVAAMRPLREAMRDPELGVDMAMLVHVEQDHRLTRPIQAGEELQVGARLEAVDLAATGHTFTVAVTLTTGSGETVAEVLSRMLIRKTGTGARVVEEIEERGATVAEGLSHLDEYQTFRYAHASGDDNPIHLDPEAARRSGFPGIVCHGMCTMAMASKVVLDGTSGGDPARLRRITVKFSRPVFPGQSLTTTVWRPALRTSGEPGTSLYGFETVNEKGAVVIRNGLSVVADSDA